MCEYCPPIDISSSWVPLSFISPSEIRSIWSASLIVLSLCAITRSVLSLQSSEIASCIALSLSASTLAVASSRITILESLSIHF